MNCKTDKEIEEEEREELRRKYGEIIAYDYLEPMSPCCNKILVTLIGTEFLSCIKCNKQFRLMEK